MANKKGRVTDDDVRTAEELINIGREAAQREINELKEKLRVAPWLYEMAGKIKGMNLTEIQARFYKLILLKQVKESKEYREKYGMTWEQFCEYIGVGVTRRWVDEKLAELKPFKIEFLEVFFQFFGQEFHKIKYLGEAVSEGSAEIKDNAIVYQGETIPLTPEHKDDILALLERLEESYKAQLEEKNATIRTKDRLIKAKEDLIHRQEKELQRLEKQARGRNLTPEEDAFLQQMENLRIGFDGYMLKVDPENMQALFKENNPTPRMKAAYLSTLEYMKKQILAAYDTAHELYSDPSMSPERVWQPGMTA